MLQLRAAKGNPAIQSQSSTEMDIKEEPASGLTSGTSDVAIKAEDSATPTTPGNASVQKNAFFYHLLKNTINLLLIYLY